nr:vesicle-fusing ATPase [Seculamonas ecuadoriensis]
MSRPSPASRAPQQKHFRVRGTPENDLVASNLLFCAETEFERFPVYISYNNFVFIVNAHPAVPEGVLTFNAVHREICQVSQHEDIVVNVIDPPRPSDYLTNVRFELDLVLKNRVPSEPVDAEKLAERFKRIYSRQVFTVGQKLVVDFSGINLMAWCSSVETVGQLDPSKMRDSSSLASIIGATSGMLGPDTVVTLAKRTGSNLPFTQQKGGTREVFRNDFSFEKLGIGGLDEELGAIFRRAFASRIYPPATIAKLGIKHVKGILLYGPPGTGKTLMARQIGKMLNCKEPKVVNGPEILDKFVGGTEEKIRELFAEAEEEYREHGEDSELHLIIFDEIDAICKKRGSTRDNTGVNDSMVNQLLSKLDGVEAVNNVLVIGMTNRKDMIDDAMLRPGRFEVQIEVNLPDEAGRLQILRIHTRPMLDNKCLSPDVDFQELAVRTKNFSGAELAGLVRSATSFALNRNVDINDPSKTVKDEIVVGMVDFEHGLEEVHPIFGVSTDEAAMYRGSGLISYGPSFDKLMNTCRAFVHQVEKSKRTPLLTVLLEGPLGSGKTALAAELAIQSQFPFLKFVSPESMVGYAEGAKCASIAKVFEDSYKSPLSIIVLDNIERLVEYVHIGPRFSNAVLQTLLVLLKKLPPKDRKLMVIGTTSSREVLESMDLVEAFNIALHVPALMTKDQIRTVLEATKSVDSQDLDDIVAVTPVNIGIKQLLLVIEMAISEYLAEPEDESGAATSGDFGKIHYERYLECLQDCGFLPDNLDLDDTPAPSARASASSSRRR